VFDGLLPEPHNSAVLDLLFVMAHWHGLAKLRMHHDLTLDILDAVTVSLGKLLRSFSNVTCSAFETKELRREAAARIRRGAKKAAASQRRTSHTPADVSHPIERDSNGPGVSPVQAATNPHSSAGHRIPEGAAARRPKKFNLNTYKIHSYGDYVKSIREYGTTDSYSTETVRFATV
jgi:hypothetical protein